mgnify:CR=1 FL=1
MDFEVKDSETQKAFRTVVRAWIVEHAPKNLYIPSDGDYPDYNIINDNICFIFFNYGSYSQGNSSFSVSQIILSSNI